MKIAKEMRRETLLYADSRNNADMLYFSGISIPDAFFGFTHKSDRCAVLSPLELGRAREASKFDRMYDLTAVLNSIDSNLPRDDISAITAVLHKYGISNLQVPRNFPAYQLERLRANGFDIAVCPTEIFPERKAKKAYELDEIRRANSVAEAAFEYSEEILRQSEIRRGGLFWKGERLTSEILLAQIQRLALALGADASDTIAASGNQACNPHEHGHGPIAANSLVVIDIFPRLKDSGYNGDMTRTFLKGEPSKAQFKLVETVIEAQEIALCKIAAGVNGASIHKTVVDFFDKKGYKTECKRGVWSGFFHSTGHGLGLDVHEAPSLGMRDVKLAAGNVVTVEPGLYYKGIGGCRIEDNVVVRKEGAQLLSNYHYNWIID